MKVRINDYTKLAAACRRLKFEIAKEFKVLWLIEKLPYIRIKEPFNTMYQRSKKSK